MPYELAAVVMCVLLCHVVAFMPEYSNVNFDDDFTQKEIVEIALKYVFLYETPLSVEDIMFNETTLEEFRDVGGFIDECPENRSQVVKVIDEVTDFTTLTDLEYRHDPTWTFSNERIQEGHKLLFNLRERLITSLLEKPANFTPCRRLIGNIFHLILSFYSNTNWVETHPNGTCTYLGVQHDLPYRVAAANVPSCKPCRYDQHGCQDNLLLSDSLTSGYWNRDCGTENKDSRNSSVLIGGKCCHGGITDHTDYNNELHTVSGGINKMSGNPELSPHYFLHNRAAVLAVFHCIRFLIDEDYGLTAIVGQSKVWDVLGTDTIHVYIDTPPTPETETLASLIHQPFKLLSALNLRQACIYTQTTTLVIVRMENVVTEEDLPEECMAVTTHVFKIIPDLKHNQRPKRSLTTTGGMNFYNIIAQVSGGSVYHATKTDIGAVVDLIKETVSAKPPVSVMKFLLKSAERDTFTIPVDVLMDNVTIKIQSTVSSMPSFNLCWPDGTQERFGNPRTATKQTLGRRLVVVKLINPIAGLWNFTRNSTVEYEIEISAKTDLDFAYKFMQSGPGGYGEYPLVGRPIAGANTSLQVTVPLYDKVTSIDSIVVLDDGGMAISKATLHNIGGRRGKSLFKTYIPIPASGFKLAVEGRDKANNVFRRMDPRVISTLAIKLEVLKVSGALYVNSTVTLSYRVTNVGGGSTRVVVKISDDKGFSQVPDSHTHTLSNHQNVTGTFSIKAGQTKGETVTVTVSANAEGAPANKVQYSVQRLTVEENITRVIDTIPPTCNVTQTTGLCDIGTDLCACVNKTWNMEAVIADAGFGLQSVFVSGAGNTSTFHHSTFMSAYKGVVRANLSADCCHQRATITAVDLAGNVGLCNVTFKPNFVAPDSKLCQSQPTSGSIPCMSTKVIGSCDLRNTYCTGSSCNKDSLCQTQTWEMHAEIGNHSNAIHQVTPINVGPNATLVHNKDLVQLILDCCHTSALIKFVDIAGNVGQCQANITVSNNIASKVIDTIPPTCNVTQTTGLCDIGTDLCACVNKTWNMEAVIADAGFGLQSVFVSGAGNTSTFHHSTFMSAYKGVVRANLSADCCHQRATITAVDLAGNVGLCNVTFKPNFVAPDSKLCQSQPTSGSIPCMSTKVIGSCDLRNTYCTGSSCNKDSLCQTQTWEMHAEIGNHSNAIHQVTPINVGPNATLVHNKDLVQLILDCCHTSALIKFVDIAGNVGQCQANITVSNNIASKAFTVAGTPPPSSSLPITLIAGASAGGVVLIITTVVIGFLVKRHMARAVAPMA